MSEDCRGAVAAYTRAKTAGREEQEGREGGEERMMRCDQRETRIDEIRSRAAARLSDI